MPHFVTSFFQIFTIVILAYSYGLEISVLKILGKFLKLILKTKQTSFLVKNLVQMPLLWVIRAFLKYSCSQLCFLIVPYYRTKFQKNPTEKVPRTKWTNCVGHWCKMPYIGVNLFKIYIIFTYYLIIISILNWVMKLNISCCFFLIFFWNNLERFSILFTSLA